MKEIREGLEKNLDISFYANSKYNWEQMFHIINISKKQQQKITNINKCY